MKTIIHGNAFLRLKINTIDMKLLYNLTCQGSYQAFLCVPTYICVKRLWKKG